MSLNPFKNTLAKVRVLLKEDDTLTKDQCSQFQWQLLSKVPGCDFNFTLGKGGINTIFYSASSKDRVVCYPDEALDLLTALCKRDVFCYEAYDKKKNLLAFFLQEEDALKCEGARYVKAVSFRGKSTLLWKKERNLFDKVLWQKKTGA